MSRRISIVYILLLFLPGLFSCQLVTYSPVIFQEDFKHGSLDSSKWEVTMDGNFAEAVVDVTDVDPGEGVDYRLRLRANTIGTSTQLKFLGVRGRSQIDFETGAVVTFDLDWNNQANGSYLTASLYLCPTASNNPIRESNWLKFEYVGVPPGRNVRINICDKVDGVGYQLHNDWGPTDELGRPLGRPLGLASHRIDIYLDKNNLRVAQDGQEIYPLSKHNLDFTMAYLYFQMSSGTNYPSREVYFDNIVVQDIP